MLRNLLNKSKTTYKRTICYIYNNNYRDIPIHRVRQNMYKSETYKCLDIFRTSEQNKVGITLQNQDINMMDSNIIQTIDELLLYYGVVVIKKQKLKEVDLVNFANKLGNIEIHPLIKGKSDFPSIIEIKKEQHEKVNFGEQFHSDNSYLSHPSRISIVYGKTISSVSNSTLFSCCVSMYENLSPMFQYILQKLTAEHTASKSYNVENVMNETTNSENKHIQYCKRQSNYLFRKQQHPIIITIDENKRNAIFVNEMFTTNISHLNQSESDYLLKFILSLVHNTQYQYEHKWEEDDLVLWDNRVVQHKVLPNPNTNGLRVLQRITVK